MINFNNSIDTNIFYALQITRKCMEMRAKDRSIDIPNILLISNIGVGKSTAVKLFAEINDYELVLLRISNETPDTITGYDTVKSESSGEGINRAVCKATGQFAHSLKSLKSDFLKFIDDSCSDYNIPEEFKVKFNEFATIKFHEAVENLAKKQVDMQVLTNNDDDDHASAKHIRPSWFQKILKNKEQGKKTLLFLDELTTANPQTQGAALNLVFDRKCHDELLPDDTLIVAAGNYAENLSDEMTVLAPMLNRFIIFNVQPKTNDIDHYLCKYQGSLAGKRIDLFEEIKKSMSALMALEKPLDEDFLHKAGEYIENNLNTEAKALQKEGLLDFNVTSMKDIYSDTNEVDEPLSNLTTYRTLNYLLDAAVACYACFGKEGLMSDNFKNIINGTVGLGLTRDPKTREVVRNILTDRFFMNICDTSNDIEKMMSNKLPEYQEFFRSFIENETRSVFSIGDMNILTNKIKELRADKEIDTIDRPLDEDVISKICSSIKSTITKSISNKISSSNGGNLIDEIKANPEDYIGKIHTWNNLNALVTEIGALITDPSKKYPAAVKTTLNDLRSDCRQCSTHLKMTKKGLQRSCPDLVATFPDIM